MEEFRNADADEGADEVAPDQCSWLGEGSFDCPIAENGGGAKRGENGRHAAIDEVLCVAEDCLQYGEPAEGADEGPEADDVLRMWFWG